MLNRIIDWCGSNTPTAKCTRTIFQGVLAVLITYAADIVAGLGLDPTTCAVMTALVMAVLSPIQAAIGDVSLPDCGYDEEVDA